MTTYQDVPLDFDAVSEPISGDTKATVELVGNDWLADDDWIDFKQCCILAAEENTENVVNPNRVRTLLQDPWGYLVIEPRRYSAFWSRAAGKNGFLDAAGWTTNTDTKGGNAGKPTRMYRLRT